MIDGEDRQLFERSLRHATETHTGAALDAALADLGWPDALSVDTYTAVSLLFELQGWANATSSAIDQVLAQALGHPATAVLLPPIGQWNPPGTVDGNQLNVQGVGTSSLGNGLTGHPGTSSRTPLDGHDPGSNSRNSLDGHDPGDRDDAGGVVTTNVGGQSERTDLEGSRTGHLGGDETALVVAGVGESWVAFEVEIPALTRRAVGGIDPSLGLVEVTGEVAGARELGAVDWRAAVAWGQLALSHELLGASRRMLELAREHALERVQFGRPIAMFQAVRHRLAETLVAVEAADAALDAAWADQGSQAAAMAKATAGRAARVAARHCQQVLAGIGFTTEHPFHRYVKRVFVLEQLLGSPRALSRQLGLDILEHRRLPALLPL